MKLIMACLPSWILEEPVMRKPQTRFAALTVLGVGTTTVQANKDMLRETVGRLLHLRVSEQLSQEPKLL